MRRGRTFLMILRLLRPRFLPLRLLPAGTCCRRILTVIGLSAGGIRVRGMATGLWGIRIAGPMRQSGGVTNGDFEHR